MAPDRKPSVDDTIDEAVGHWVQSGRLHQDGRVVPEAVLGACCHQLAVIANNGMEFILESGAFEAGGRNSIMVFPAAWLLLGSAPGSWLASRLLARVQLSFILGSSDDLCRWEAQAQNDWEAENQEWWSRYEMLRSVAGAYAVATCGAAPD